MFKFYFILLFSYCVAIINTKSAVKPVSFKDLDFVINSQSTKLPKRKIPTTTMQTFQLNFNDISFSINGSKMNQSAVEETAHVTSTVKKCNRICRKLQLGRNRRRCCRRNNQSR